MAQGPPRKEDVSIRHGKMMRQPTEKKRQKGGGAPEEESERQETDAGNQGI